MNQRLLMGRIKSGFSLFESLVVIALLSLTLTLSQPLLFSGHSKLMLDRSIESIRSFVYFVQNKAQLEQKRYSLIISQRDNNWCMVAIHKAQINSKKELACDCLKENDCSKFSEYHLLTLTPHPDFTINTQALYPQTLLNIDGIAATIESKCLRISHKEASDILVFNHYGTFNVIPKHERSNCHQ